MGYCMKQQPKGHVFIAQERQAEALSAVINVLRNRADIMWVDVTQALLTQTLHAMLVGWGWAPTMDKEGNIVDLRFQHEKMGDEKALFSALAPFVKNGSFIEMLGDDGDHWRWVFDGARCFQIWPVLVWNGPIPDDVRVAADFLQEHGFRIDQGALRMLLLGDIVEGP